MHAERMHTSYHQDVKNIQIRNVPERVHRVLVRRAAKEGQSLQEYLLSMLETTASRPTVREVLERAGRRATGRVRLEEAAKIIREEREGR